MIRKFTIGDLRLTFSIARIRKVVGVNSRLDDGNHILMWDFDNHSLDEVKAVLCVVQKEYSLPRISILNSGKLDHWLAYCFKRLEWTKAVQIIAATPLVDWNFFKYGVYRGRFTLRVSPKNQREIKLAWLLMSPYPAECSVADLKSWVRYETLKGE